MILKKGSKGKEVGNWQKFLNTIIQSLFNQHVEPLKIDEDFGEATKRITKRYQFYRKLDADGIVGKDTTSEAIKDGFKPMEQSKVTREINEIILHITANGNGLTGQELFDYIDKMHRDNGWDGIGYHWLIDKNGLVIEGRDENKVGAHCKARGKNHGTIGISYDARGNDKTPYAVYGIYFQSPEQKEAFERLVKEKMAEFNISIENVHGHNFYDRGKACPCFNAEQDREFKKAIS